MALTAGDRDEPTGRTCWTQRAGTFVLWAVALLFLTAFLFVPLAAVFTEAFAEGLDAYRRAVTEPEAWNAIRLTLVTALIVVPLNLVFGVAAAWALARFEFPGRRVLIALIELPFAVSPVVSGLVFVLLFGAQGWSARGWPSTTSASSSRCPASCLRRCLSPCPSSLAS